MKKIFPVLGFLIVISLNLYSQDYLISTHNGDTITDCSGFFYDSGGATSDYGNGETYIITFKSNNIINTHTKVYFDEFDIDPTDTLYIYDGTTTSSPLLGAYNNTNTLLFYPVQASITNSSGNLTFKFRSNGSDVGTGWKGTISCIPECQTVFSVLDAALTMPNPTDSNYVDICFHDTIKFVGSGVFPQNGLVYPQSNATSTFEWDFGDGTTATGQTVTHLYNQVRGYNVALKITDSHGCVSTNSLGTRVRIADNPLASIHPIPSICSREDSLIITIGFQNN
ncbi:MAG: PKD domain-containing protein, partial [Bacteroidetes bacterium]|nr:PKD domain-containing protein [Bacteroidota bacterium]